MKNVNNIKVYLHRNIKNGKVYIGTTSQVPKNRWKSGYGYYRQTLFYSEIKKYGWDEFEHIILCDHLDKKESDIKERELIEKYHSDDIRYGYNITSGGRKFNHTETTRHKMSNSHLGIGAKRVRQYSQSGKLVHEYSSISEAAKATGISGGNISSNCNGKLKLTGGYIWGFTKN